MGIFDIFGTGDQQAAAQAQINGIQQGYNQLSTLYGQGQNQLTSNYASGLAPFLQNYAGAQQGTTALGNALGLNGPSGNAAATQAFENNPGFQFQEQQGDNAINAAAAANGTLNSGNQLTALSNYNQGLAGTSWNNYVSALQPYLGASNSAATGIGSLYSGLGTQLNNSSMTQGNAAYGAQTSIGNANANADLAGLNASDNILNAGMNLGGMLLGFANGGRPPIGRPSVVGERGPELFVPSEPGTVIPHEVLQAAARRAVPKRAPDYASRLAKFTERKAA